MSDNGLSNCGSRDRATRALLDAGPGGRSDWSVAPLSPLLRIDAAVNRRTLDGKHPNGWVPQQKISVSDALEAYTLGAAYAAPVIEAWPTGDGSIRIHRHARRVMPSQSAAGSCLALVAIVPRILENFNL